MDSYLTTDDYSVQPYSAFDTETASRLPEWLQNLDDPSRDRVVEAVDRIYGVLEEVVEDYPVDSHVAIGVGETDEPFIQDEMDGATGGAFDSTFVICYSPNTDGWADELETATAHEYAHTRYIEQARKNGQGDGSYRKWQQLLLEAHGMHIADSMTGSDPPWRDAVSTDYLQEWRDRIIEELGRPAVWTDDETDGLPFFGGGNDWERWTGYTLAWHVGEQLLEEGDIEDLPSLTYDDAVEAVDAVLEDGTEDPCRL